MPWGSWITCEETVNGPDVGPDFTGASNIPLTKPHGYIFEVPVRGESRPPSRSPAAGRFAHEAVAYDPHAGVPLPDRGQLRLPVRLLPLQAAPRPDADRPAATTAAGCRCSRSRAAQPAPGGQPAARAPRTTSSGSTSTTRRRRSRTRRAWSRRPRTTTPLTYVGNQGRAQGAAYFSRLEGAVYDDGVVYFSSTQGGGAAETEHGPHASAATATGSARSGRTTRGRERLQLRLPVAGPGRARLPGQRHHQPARHAGRLRGQRRRQLPARADPPRASCSTSR